MKLTRDLSEVSYRCSLSTDCQVVRNMTISKKVKLKKRQCDTSRVSGEFLEERNPWLGCDLEDKAWKLDCGDSYLFFALALKDKQLSRSGSKKAARLIAAVRSITTNAKMVIDHLSKKTVASQHKNKSKIDSLQAAIIKYNNQKNSCLSEDVLDWHTMCRLEKEVILLENIAEEASLSDVEVIQSDDHVGGGICTEEREENGDEEEDELALLVEAVEEQ
ncbi:hypothetical protein EDC96DRAFT_564803 [Choanephora cucurbitarum]|nr:hypothetical protein EDC96DRAFT_564803 [Choanephora cucurbitarum]